MRGYFGIGVERISKPMNAGSLFRTANAFGASFVFTVDANYTIHEGRQSDTARSDRTVPFYSWDSVDDMILPRGCTVVGVELLDDAVELPSFRHPQTAAYILGPERGNLSEAMLERCQEVIKIPTQFCLNVGVAGALVMYDRVLSLGRYGERPVVPGGPGPLPESPKWQRPPRIRDGR